MSYRHFAAVLIALVLAATVGISAQRGTAQRPMTNQDVLDMVQAKLSTELIVVSVENARSPRFDVQAAALIGLKRVGTDDRIVQAMIKAMNPTRGRGSVSPDPTSSANSPSSYEDGYQMGWMYGDQLRRSRERYNPDDIVLPGTLIHDMTVKLGAINYEKWENGYLKGHEDGRMGRPRSPTAAAATRTAQPTEEALEPSPGTRAAIRSAKAAHPGASIFAVFHDHGGMSEKHCEGLLMVLKDTLTLQGTEANDDQVHKFKVVYNDVREIKKNSLTIFFHVKMKDGRNFNFWTPDEEVADVVAKILSVAPGIRK